MAYEHRDGSGSLFRNEKDGVESRPDYRGEAKVNGKIYQLSAWLKEGSKGKFLSISIQPKESYQGEKTSSKSSTNIADLSDDIPF